MEVADTGWGYEKVWRRGMREFEPLAEPTRRGAQCARCQQTKPRGGWYVAASAQGPLFICTPCRVYEVTQLERVLALAAFIEETLNGAFDETFDDSADGAIGEPGEPGEPGAA